MGYSFVLMMRKSSANLARTYALNRPFASKGGIATQMFCRVHAKDVHKRCRYALGTPVVLVIVWVQEDE